MKTETRARSAVGTEWVLRASADDLQLNVREGEYLVVTPGSETPVVALRSLPENYGAIASALADGQLTAESHRPDATMAELVRLASQPGSITHPTVESL